MKEIDLVPKDQLPELNTSTLKISPFLTKEEKRYVRAGFDKKIVEYEAEGVQRAIMVIINTAYAELGQKVGGGTKAQRMEYIIATTKMVYNDIKYYTPNLTLEDFKLAIELGIRNHYGEYIGISVITMHNFVENYLNSTERNDALKKQKRFIEDQLPKPPMSNEEKDRLKVECLRVCYKNFKDKGFLIDCGGVNYQFLIDRGVINLSIDERIAIYDKAKLQVDAEALQQPLSFSEMLQKMRNQSEDVLGYQIRSREIVLKQYFSNITEEELEKVIKKYLDEKRPGWKES